MIAPVLTGEDARDIHSFAVPAEARVTHAEMADRIGIINKGRLVLVDEKAKLMRRLGRKELRLHLQEKLDAVPAQLAAWSLALSEDGLTLVFTFGTELEQSRIAQLLREVTACGIEFRDLETQQSSLEDIFVSLLKGAA